MELEEQYDKIYRYCYFKLRHAQTAEDVTQETFLRFLERGGYQRIGRPLAFLYTVARNLCMDEFRRRKPEELAEGWADERSVYDTDSGAGAERLDLYRALAALTERERELLLLRYVNEVPFRDLEKLCGRSRFALRRELKRLLEDLGRRLSDE